MERRLGLCHDATCGGVDAGARVDGTGGVRLQEGNTRPYAHPLRVHSLSARRLSMARKSSNVLHSLHILKNQSCYTCLSGKQAGG